jgi:hypothetical protein
MGQSILVRLTQAQANALAWMHEAASKDDARPTIASYNLEWEVNDGDLTLTVVTTDSYMLAVRELTFDKGTFEAEPETGQFVVTGKRFADALKSAAKAGKQERLEGQSDVLVEVEDDVVNVASVNGGIIEVVKGVDAGSYPNWRQLIPDLPDEDDEDGYDIAIAPHLLYRASRVAVQPPSAGTGTQVPLRITIQDKLKPALMQSVRTDGTGTLTILAMPVRL